MEVPYVIGVIVILMLILGTFEHIRMQRLSGERGEVDVCKYAKSFDYRSVDTKIMREVWNELHLWLGKYDGKAFPIKTEDKFEDTYNMDPEDLDDIYLAIADRLGINTENPQKKPYFNKVTSVKNLVLFLHHQSIVRNSQQYDISRIQQEYIRH
ncbi:hypothetical protein ACMXYQ_07065 [Neptuniibacter sp. PT34_22]|uniref:hypothetical protein n=1 Tax=Neptuniibacter sp. PT34_22 TaxID=3398205 RepID=UPI0039F51229